MTGATAGSSGSSRPAEQAGGSVEAPRSAGGNPGGGSPLRRGFFNPVYSPGSPLGEGVLGQGQQVAGPGVREDGAYAGVMHGPEVPGGGSSAEIVDDGTGQGIDETTGTTSGGGSGESEDQEEGLARRSEGSPEGVHQPALD